MMALTPDEIERGTKFIMSMPGKRGIDIPEDIHDTIASVGNGITHPTWGRQLTPHQKQWLYNQGHHTPAAIHDAFGNLPHPHAHNLSLNEYQTHVKALQLWKEHSGQSE